MGGVAITIPGVLLPPTGALGEAVISDSLLTSRVGRERLFLA